MRWREKEERKRIEGFYYGGFNGAFRVSKLKSSLVIGSMRTKETKGGGYRKGERGNQITISRTDPAGGSDGEG